nr:MAG TPA: hypothetical protein [Caudoviricetes sp.]DAM69071.1 MAG TPA: hypothetical protein [Caudoviricetes sp.]DAW55485.1 MAG TPA: hypothetical protein [Caudoviricetes sp.]
MTFIREYSKIITAKKIIREHLLFRLSSKS